MDRKSSTPSLAQRMKNYELVSTQNLMCRTPVIVRIDGKNFGNWVKKQDINLFSERLSDCMKTTMSQLMDNIQGASFAYTISDEISILIRDYDTVQTSAWLGYSIQKMSSIIASMTTAYFNNSFDYGNNPAMFDARVFNLPKEEVTNYFIWRQHSGINNSITKLGTSIYGHSKCMNRKAIEIKDIIDVDYPKNSWDNLGMEFKYGIVVRKDEPSQVLDFKFKDHRSYIDDEVYISQNN